MGEGVGVDDAVAKGSGCFWMVPATRVNCELIAASFERVGYVKLQARQAGGGRVLPTVGVVRAVLVGALVPT